MKIFNLIIMKADDYAWDCLSRDNKLAQVRKDNQNLTNTFKMVEKKYEERIKNLINKHKEDLKRHIDLEHNLQDEIFDLETRVHLLTVNITSLKRSNSGYKSNNARLKNEKKKLEDELANSYKREILPPDKTKSKQIPRVKSSSKLSYLASSMHK